MKLDEKYFVPFLFVVAAMAALLIVFFTIHSRNSQEQTFRKAIVAQDSLKFKYMPVIGSGDSLQVQSFSDAYVIVDFWATWTSSFSKKAHQQLARLKQKYPDNLEIIAAVVQDKPKNVQQYIARYHYPFHFVNGTRVFNQFNVPGVPTQLVYAPGSKLQSIFTGSTSEARMDSLQVIIGDGR